LVKTSVFIEFQLLNRGLIASLLSHKKRQGIQHLDQLCHITLSEGRVEGGDLPIKLLRIVGGQLDHGLQKNAFRNFVLQTDIQNVKTIIVQIGVQPVAGQLFALFKHGCLQPLVLRNL